ncbi:MAG: SIS domain-containing protein [bacterium]|nr:SIS domain-containing protein [bacterium]
MEDAIRDFPQQFDFEPKIENEDKLAKKDKFIVCGMGGSHLGAWLLKRHNPNLDLLLHRDYGLPRVPEYFLRESLIILSSYSGNTEEVLDVGRLAFGKGLSLAVIADSGELLDFAKENEIPYIDLPNTGIEPRMAVGFTMLAIARLMQDGELEEEVRKAGKQVEPSLNKETGERLAEKLVDKKIVVYSSTLNLPLAYNWKIKFNETAKIPASYNVFPELCHNELSGYDAVDLTSGLSRDTHVLILMDAEDDPRILKRMKILKSILNDKKIPASEITISGESALTKIFNSILLAEWVALTLAHHYGVSDAKTPLIAEFKKRMSEEL